MRAITVSLVFSFNKKWPLLLVAQLVNDYTETNNMKLPILLTMKEPDYNGTNQIFVKLPFR